MTSLHELGAVPLGRLVRTGQASCRDIAGAFLDRIDALNPRYNALVSLRPRADILREAEAADGRVAAGEPLGPLHGLPMAVKDLSPTAGLRTTFGSPIFADFVPQADSLLAERLKAAGALIIGKTNTPEFGLGSHTYNPVFGATRNAFDPTRSAGGSSGGAAVALALGLLPVADGSDFGGSLRNPAAYANIFGLRPAQGRVPTWPSADPYFAQLSTDGPMARTVEDLVLLLDVMAGYDPRVPLSLPAEPTFGGGDLPAVPRVGWLGDLGGHLPFEPGILDLCADALNTMSAAGVQVDPVTPAFDFEALWRAFVVLRQFNQLARLKPLYEEPGKRALLKPEAVWEVEGGLRLGAADLSDAIQMRGRWYGEIRRLFDTVDFLAIPSAQVFPFPVEMHWPQTISGRAMDSYHRWMEVIVPATLSGCPVISVPAGFKDGLPMGLQIIGKPRGERALLAFARAYEALLPVPAGAL